VFADVLPREPEQSVEPGLCGTCQNARIVRSDRGSVFHRCLLAHKDGRFAKYPRLPVVRCVGWSPSEREYRLRVASIFRFAEARTLYPMSESRRLTARLGHNDLPLGT
jgi:hypothetical protein